MKHFAPPISLLLAAWIPRAAAVTFDRWEDNHVSAEICTWVRPGAALIRDTVYLDGGDIKWVRTLDDGQPTPPQNIGDPEGLIYRFRLNNTIDSETNVTGLIVEDPISKARGGMGNTNEPYFIDEGMLANDYQFFLYGGALFQNVEMYEGPDEDEILGYQVYENEPQKSGWKPGFDEEKLPDDVSRYIAFGGAVSAPSENKAWYFSGLTTRSGGEIAINDSPNDTALARNISDTLIEVNMKEQFSEEWTKRELPNTVQGRANAEVVWVPIGDQGILVVLGGVKAPVHRWYGYDTEDDGESAEENDEFMQEIDIYDIANDEWHKQQTEGGPSARAWGCAVLGTASDSSSFNIYYYGGYDGINIQDDFEDDVWVLSLPSFTWTQLNNGTSRHARAGHVCFSPYPDQMMVFGGQTPLKGQVQPCLTDGPIVLFNLTSGEWMDSYHPNEFSDYGVPNKVIDVIGGDATGGASLRAPSDGWASDELEELFAIDYDTEKIANWRPYIMDDNSTGRPDVPDDDDDEGGGGGGGLPSWVAPVLGVVLGLMVLTGALVVFFLWRRRRIFKGSHTSDASTEDPGKRVFQWIRGQQPGHQPTEKAPTMTTSEDTPASPDVAVAAASVSQTAQGTSIPQETAGTPVWELDAASPPAELSEQALTPVEIVQKSFHKPPRTLSDPSYSDYSFLNGDVNSTISRSSAAAVADGEPLPDSPSLGVGPETHVRSLSETLAGAAASNGAAEDTNNTRATMAASRASDQVSEPPVSPPTTNDFPGDDYLTARNNLVSPMRRSVFHESEEDMGKQQ